MRISDWSSDVCSSDLAVDLVVADVGQLPGPEARHQVVAGTAQEVALPASHHPVLEAGEPGLLVELLAIERLAHRPSGIDPAHGAQPGLRPSGERSEEHTSELQSLMRISYAVFCL